MAYIDDLGAPRPRKVRPLFGGAQKPPAPDVNVTYGGQSPIGSNGAPNQDYTGNTGVVKPPPPPVVPPPPSGAGGGGTTPPPATPPPPTVPNQGTTTNYAQALDALYRKYFYRAPEAGELNAHVANLTAKRGTLWDIESELQREAARLQLKPPTTAPTAPAEGRGTAPAGVDPGKWAAGHTSPKYAFMEVSRKYDQRTAEGRAQTLAELQRDYPQWYAGWVNDGDKLRFGGGQLHGDWDGYDEFDAWYGSKAGVWSPQWIPTRRNGQAYVSPEQQAAQSAGGGATGGTGSGGAVPGGAAGAGGGAATPGQSGLSLDPLTGQLGGSGGFDFGITGEYGYDDPSTQKLEEFLRLMIDEKTNPINDPARNEYANTLRQRFQSLIEPGSGANAGATALDQQLQDAINQLTNPALTENDRARLENRALEPMERDRAIRLQQEKERLAARGLGESSGIITESLAGIDRDYDARRGEVQRDLSIYEREQQDARRREAIGYGTQRRNVLGTELDREQGRYGQALTMAEALSNLSGQQRGEQDARMREALTYTSLFPEMDERRLRLAMETLGMSNGMANTPSIFNTLSNLQAQANRASQQGQQDNADFWKQMGDWMSQQNWGGE